MRRALNKIKDFALPAAGFALGGPLGAAAGGALAGATGRGRPQLKNVLTGAAAGGAAGLGAGALGAVGGQGGSAMGSSLRNMFTGAGRAALANPEITAGIARGAADMYGSNQASGIRQQELDLMRDRFGEERRQTSQEEERRRMIAQLLAPMWQDMQSRSGFGR